ncbi:MAG: YlxM family DNA-binding protein [Clostridia bacterium]|nr:YlxM family DNA-binding protein [Clostridia bacterium]
MENFAKINLYYDFYGALLTARQQQLIELYYGENWSLAEIGQEMQISRQAVYDTLKRAVQTLQKYESKLGLVAKTQQQQALLKQALALLNDNCQEASSLIWQVLESD